MSKKKDSQARPRRRYTLVFREETAQRQICNWRFNKFALVSTICVAVVAFILIIYSIIAFTPARTLVPGYPDASSRAAALTNAIKIDSLESLMSRWNIYAENLRRVVEGETPLSVDSVMRAQNTAPEQRIDAQRAASQDSVLRAAVAASNQFTLSNRERKLPVEGLHFFQPLKGVVAHPFDPVMHPYLDIAAPAGSVVMSILDGTVIFTDWSDEYQYTIGVQHQQGLISFYRNNQKLLKELGEKVSAGSSIALLGSDQRLSASGDHLHFELWSEGEAIDPTLYISF